MEYIELQVDLRSGWNTREKLKNTKELFKEFYQRVPEANICEGEICELTFCSPFYSRHLLIQGAGQETENLGFSWAEG